MAKKKRKPRSNNRSRTTPKGKTGDPFVDAGLPARSKHIKTTAKAETKKTLGSAAEAKDVTKATKKDEQKEKADARLKQGQAIQGIASITEAFALGIGALSQAEAIRQKGKFEEAQFIENAEQLDRSALDTLDIGREGAQLTLEDAKKLRGTQRAQLAATGVDIESGSARDVQDETIRLGLQDAKTIKTNAFRIAFGKKRQAIGQRAQARQGRISRKFRERTTLISGGLGALSAATSGIGSLASSGAFGSPQAASPKAATGGAT